MADEGTFTLTVGARELHYLEGDLQPDETLGGAENISSRVSLGVYPPVQVTDHLLASARAPAQAADLLRAHDFYDVVLSPSILPRAGERILECDLSVSLEASDAGSVIAWDIAPLRYAPDTVKVTQDMTIEVPELSISGLKLTPNLRYARTKEAEERPVHVIGAGLGESIAEWQIRRTDTRAVDGPYTMRLLVRASHGSHVEVKSALTARVRASRFAVTAHWTSPSGQRERTVVCEPGLPIGGW